MPSQKIGPEPIEKKVINEQPKTAEAKQAEPVWMARPSSLKDVPSGLEYLSSLDRIIVEQQVDDIDSQVFAGWVQVRKYIIKNTLGENIYYAAEQEEKGCCGSSGFTIHIVDHANQECLKVYRKAKSCIGCCWCAGCCDRCAHEIKVEASSNGQLMGYIKQKGSFWKAHYDVLDCNRNAIMKIEGPCCICNCKQDNNFKLASLDGTARGGVVRKYAGKVKEASLADDFVVEFPKTLSVSSKATIISASFLIDLMFFESEADDEGGGDGGDGGDEGDGGGGGGGDNAGTVGGGENSGGAGGGG